MIDVVGFNVEKDGTGRIDVVIFDIDEDGPPQPQTAFALWSLRKQHPALDILIEEEIGLAPARWDPADMHRPPRLRRVIPPRPILQLTTWRADGSVEREMVER